MSETEIKELIVKELSRFNFKIYTKGFKYLTDAIFISIIDEDAIDNLSKNIFPLIAEKYHEKSSSNIKWCIDQAINTMYNNTDMKKVSEYFNIGYSIKPSLKLIIYTIMCKVKVFENKEK